MACSSYLRFCLFLRVNSVFCCFFSFFFFDKYVYVTENIFEQLWGSLFINNILLLDGE